MDGDGDGRGDGLVGEEGEGGRGGGGDMISRGDTSSGKSPIREQEDTV